MYNTGKASAITRGTFGLVIGSKDGRKRMDIDNIDRMKHGVTSFVSCTVLYTEKIRIMTASHTTTK